MSEFDPTEPVWRRAWRDTVGSVHSAWWFWGAEVAMAATASVLAVSVYPDDASTLEQAAIQATFVVAGFVLVGVGLLLGNLVAFATYHQRDDARLAWAHERDELARIAKKSTKRADLLREREKLGEIMAEAGDLIAGVVGPDSEDDTMKIFSDALDLFRSGGPFSMRVTRAGFTRS